MLIDSKSSIQLCNTYFQPENYTVFTVFGACLQNFSQKMERLNALYQNALAFRTSVYQLVLIFAGNLLCYSEFRLVKRPN